MFFIGQFSSVFVYIVLAVTYLVGITSASANLSEKLLDSPHYFNVKDYTLSEKLLESTSVCTTNKHIENQNIGINSFYFLKASFQNETFLIDHIKLKHIAFSPYGIVNSISSIASDLPPPSHI